MHKGQEFKNGFPTVVGVPILFCKGLCSLHICKCVFHWEQNISADAICSLISLKETNDINSQEKLITCSAGQEKIPIDNKSILLITPLKMDSLHFTQL